MIAAMFFLVSQDKLFDVFEVVTLAALGTL